MRLQDVLRFEDEHRPNLPTYRIVASGQILAVDASERFRKALIYIAELLDALDEFDYQSQTSAGYAPEQLFETRRNQARIAKGLLLNR